MTDSNVNVTYTAKANFREVIREAIAAKAAIKAMNDEAARGNKISADTVAARRAESAAAKDAGRSTDSWAKSAARAAAAIKAQNAALRAGERAARDASSATRKVGADAEAAGKKAEALGQKFEAALRKMLGIKSTENIISGSLKKISDGLGKVQHALGTPTLLIAGFAALLSFINPLVAGISALGAVAIGAASSLGTLAGSVAGLVPALSAALGVALALRVALGGVGAALKAGLTPKTGTGSTSGSSAADKQDPFSITPTEKITRAQEAYRRSIQDVRFAEQDLANARKNYRQQIDDLTDSINAYTNATKASDAANVESAQQNYANVLASSASTKADKDAALAAIQQAKQQQADDARQNAQNVADRAALRSTGVNGDRGVIEAQRAVQDAKNARRDDQIALENAKYDAAHPVSTSAGGAAGGAAADPYQQALGKLSPAAQTFVKWVVSMRSAWMDLQRTVQQAFFDRFVNDLDRLKGLLPPVQSALVSIAGALGTIADDVIKQVTSPDWKRDIVLFGQLLAPILLTAGKGLQSLLQAFKDLIIAATPFFGKVVSALAKGAEDFASFISNGRKTGSIQKALDDVYTVMGKWWTVIKNISATLYNYGKAAAPFGQWLTDGIVRITGAWKTASETATKANSPFKRWLEDTKPLLHEMSLDLGAFFGWIGQVASNKTNIDTIKDLLKAFRVKIAPKVADILQTLVDAKVPQAVVDFITALVTFIDTLVKNGGAKGIANFFNGLTWILNALTDAAKSPAGKFITNALLPLLGTLAAFALPVGPVSLLLKIFSVLTDFSPRGAISKVGGWLGDIATAVGRFVGPAFAGAATVIGDILGVLAAPMVLPKNVLPSTGKNAPQASSPLDTKTWIKNATIALTTFATGIPGLVSKAAGDAFRTTGGPAKWIKTQAKKISDFATGLYKKISASAGDVFRTVQTVASWIAKQSKKIHDWAVGVYKSVASWAGDVWRSVTGIGGWLSKQGSAIGRWASGIPKAVGRALSSIWNFIPNFGSFLANQLRGLGPIGNAAADLLGLPGSSPKSKSSNPKGFTGGGSFGTSTSTATGKWASTINQALRMAGAPQSWGADIATIIQHESSGNPNAKNLTDVNARNGIPSTGLMQLIPPNFQHYAGSLRNRGITDPLANIFAGIKYIQSRYGSPSKTPGIEALAAHRQYSYYSTGGVVAGSGNGDTVDARLTPGEYVLPKALVAKIGVQNLDALRMGMKGLQDAMVASQQPVKARVAYMPDLPRLPFVNVAPSVAGATTYNIVINNPKREEAPESMARAVRRVSYLHKGK